MHVHALESQRRRLARRAGTADRSRGRPGPPRPAGTMGGVREGGVLRPAAAVAAGPSVPLPWRRPSAAKWKTHRSRYSWRTVSSTTRRSLRDA